MRFRTVSRLVIGTVIVASVGIAALATTIAHKRAVATPVYEGVGATLNSFPAPEFSLRDQQGRWISMHSQRGTLVLLTFFYTHCPDTCPMTAQKLRTVLRGFGSEASRVRVLIITTDPLHDSPAGTRLFLRRHGLSSWHFLLGSYRTLIPIWRAYNIYVPGPGAEARSGPAHTAGMYLIDGRGREQLYLDDNVPAEDITQDLHILLNDHRWMSVLPVAPEVGARAPNFVLPALSSGEEDLQKLRGRPVLINFWATWCVPCRTEMPLLERKYRHYGGRLQIVGVDEQEPASEVRAFVRQLHITYPIALDGDGTTSYEYALAGTPTSFFVDGTGVIRHTRAGPLSASEIRVQVGRLL